jgi:serine/threonine protein kinase
MIELPEIPGYKIEKVLGQGGMSTVYLGVQENLNRQVAIKVLAPEMFPDRQYLQRFMNEARTASHLSHPNIVTIHDVGQVEKHCYIVMERLHESLVERVKFDPTSRLAPLEAFRIIRQIASALEYAHQHGVIHRDIKPDNILFRKDGTPVLVDFGIARALDSQAQLTTTGMIIGTPHYMSPEQCRGESIDGQSDLYGLGIVLYEILTGDVPYRADSAAGVLLKHVQAPIPQLPPELEKYQPLLTRLMAKNRRERVHSGAELIRLLDSFAPDSRIGTIKGIQAEEWVFDSRGSVTKKERTAASSADGSDVLTLQSPIPDSGLHPYHAPKKSRGPMFVMLLSIPFIAAAAYFLFFYNQFNTSPATSPVNTSTPPAAAAATEEKQSPPPQEKTQEKTAEEAVGANYTRYMSSAAEYLQKEDYENALVMVGKARESKDTPEAQTLEEQVKTRQTEYLFTRYFNQARDAAKSKNYKKAKENIELARKYKTGEELDKLAESVRLAERKIAEEAEKARIAAANKKRLERQDDDAYKHAVARNDIYSYEKYLERYPNGRHAEEAKKNYEERKQARLLEGRIKDDTAFGAAADANTIAAYEDYIAKYPRGLHLTEASTKIQQLKEKIIRETVVKLRLRQIRFFAAGPKAPPEGQRAFGNQFSSKDTRYIYAELTYDNNLYRVGNSSSQITMVFTCSAFTQELKGTIQQDISARSGVYSRGMGWSEPGKWPTGLYTVTVLMENQKVGQAQFTVGE